MEVAELNNEEMAKLQELAGQLGWTDEQTASEMAAVALLRSRAIEGGK